VRVLKGLLTPFSLLILSGVIVHDRATPRAALAQAQAQAQAPAAAVNGVALGRAYVPVLATGYADAWLAAARALEEGKSVAEAQATLQETWKDARIKSFRSAVAPAFARVLPEGTEPADAAKRARVAALWRAFAKGLKRGG
jgi:hypothetical protein